MFYDPDFKLCEDFVDTVASVCLANLWLRMHIASSDSLSAKRQNNAAAEPTDNCYISCLFFSYSLNISFHLFLTNMYFLLIALFCCCNYADFIHMGLIKAFYFKEPFTPTLCFIHW